MLKYFLSLGVLHLSLLYRTVGSNVKLFLMREIMISHILKFFIFFFLLLLPQKDYCDYEDTDVSFPFLLQKDFGICLRPFFVFFLFFLQNGFDIFHVLLFEAFFVFLIIFIYYFYIYPKIFIEKSYLLYYFQFSSSEFSSSEFSLSKSKEISISSKRYLGIFFSLTIYLNSSENTWG